MLWASERKACLAPAKAQNPAQPRRLAVATVNRIVPRARQHHACRLATDQKSCKPSHLPDFAIDPFRGVGDAQAHIAADVEHDNFERRDLALDAREQGRDLGLGQGIRGEPAAAPPAPRICSTSSATLSALRRVAQTL
jgi:hypothetical protein